MSCASALMASGQASSPRPGARSTNRCQTLARRGTASVPGGLLWAVSTGTHRSARAPTALVKAQLKAEANARGRGRAPVWATLSLLRPLSTFAPSRVPAKEVNRERCGRLSSKNNHKGVPSLTQTKHAHNRQGGRSTGARTRTEPAFWPLLSRVRPTSPTTDGTGVTYLLLITEARCRSARERSSRGSRRGSRTR